MHDAVGMQVVQPRGHVQGDLLAALVPPKHCAVSILVQNAPQVTPLHELADDHGFVARHTGPAEHDHVRGTATAQNGDLPAELGLPRGVVLAAHHLDRHRLHPAQQRLVHLAKGAGANLPLAPIRAGADLDVLRAQLPVGEGHAGQLHAVNAHGGPAGAFHEAAGREAVPVAVGAGAAEQIVHIDVDAGLGDVDGRKHQAPPRGRRRGAAAAAAIAAGGAAAVGVRQGLLAADGQHLLPPPLGRVGAGGNCGVAVLGAAPQPDEHDQESHDDGHHRAADDADDELHLASVAAAPVARDGASPQRRSARCQPRAAVGSCCIVATDEAELGLGGVHIARHEGLLQLRAVPRHVPQLLPHLLSVCCVAGEHVERDVHSLQCPPQAVEGESLGGAARGGGWGGRSRTHRRRRRHLPQSSPCTPHVPKQKLAPSPAAACRLRCRGALGGPRCQAGAAVVAHSRVQSDQRVLQLVCIQNVHLPHGGQAQQLHQRLLQGQL
mmetsp:Transcript_8194/g.24401  ORF Transcript_8194/g.24401 Transcript_8194/m.24401 type:complete len:494 (+) Transcript_8194:1895-3376(+)